MKKNKVDKIIYNKFSKPDDIEDIEVIIGDTSVLNISEVGDFINTVKPQKGGNDSPAIIVPQEKLSKKEKLRPKAVKNSDEIKIPENVKKAKKAKEEIVKEKKTKVIKKDKPTSKSKKTSEKSDIIKKKKSKSKNIESTEYKSKKKKKKTSIQ